MYLSAQELKIDLEGAKAATEKAADSSHKHQAAVAQLTGDNLVLVLRAKAAEDEVAALKKEREELRAAIDEQRGPWFDEVCHKFCSMVPNLQDWRLHIPDLYCYRHV